MLIAKGNNWNECELQIKNAEYTGTTWEVYFQVDCDYPARFFTDLDEAREFARNISEDVVKRLFGDKAEGVVVRVEEDEWDNGECADGAFAYVYGYEWKNGKWEVYC